MCVSMLSVHVCEHVECACVCACVSMLSVHVCVCARVSMLSVLCKAVYITPYKHDNALCVLPSGRVNCFAAAANACRRALPSIGSHQGKPFPVLSTLVCSNWASKKASHMG